DVDGEVRADHGVSFADARTPMRDCMARTDRLQKRTARCSLGALPVRHAGHIGTPFGAIKAWGPRRDRESFGTGAPGWRCHRGTPTPPPKRPENDNEDRKP